MSKVEQLIIELHNLTGLIQSAELHFSSLSQFVKSLTETNAINANLIVADTITENMMKVLVEMADIEERLSLKQQASTNNELNADAAASLMVQIADLTNEQNLKHLKKKDLVKKMSDLVAQYDIEPAA